MDKVYKIILPALFFGVLPLFSNAASLSISPASGTFEVGDRVTVKVLVSSGAPINAISGLVSFPTSLFSVESVSKSGSVLDFWVNEPNFSQGAGVLQFEGVTLGGFQGGTGTVVTAILKAIKPGSGTVSFKSGQVLANDGQGTDVTSDKTPATFSVEQRKESSKPPIKEEVKEPEAPQVSPILKSPEIVLTKKFGEQAISGQSDYPKSQVLLTFVSDAGVKVFIMSTTDGSGEFLLLVPQTLKRGVYKVSAVIIEKDITHSFSSNEISVSVGNVFSDIGMEIKVGLLLLVVTLLYLIIRTYHHLKKNKRLKIFVKREAKEAEDVVHKSFKLLKEEADGTMKKDMNEVENLIIKEIKDIEKS